MSEDDLILAYLAGAIDSDGSISIKKSTYRSRVTGDAGNPVYHEVVALKQVTPDIPDLLKEQFGGNRHVSKPGTENSKPMHGYYASDLNAAEACRLLIPYLRIKRRQAACVLELRKSKDPKYNQQSYWFTQEYPNWWDMELITATEVIEILKYSCRANVAQALNNGTIIGLPHSSGAIELPRFPRMLIERIAAQRENAGEGRRVGRPHQLIAWRERLFQQARELNKIGINGTPIYHRTGCFTPK